MCTSHHSQEQTHILVTILYFHIALNKNNSNVFYLERDGTKITTNYCNQLCAARFSPLLDETTVQANGTKKFTNLLTTNYGHLAHLSLLHNFTPFYIIYGLTLILLTWRIWWAPNNASKWQMGLNSMCKGLMLYFC